ncbi:hypothetical protein QYM36_018706, partial [Artemia franciscana]
AVDDPIYAPICSHIYAPIYAELCKLMFEKEVPSASGTGKVSFRKLLLDRCQQTFEKEKKDDEEIVSKQKALEEADTEEKKKELQMELNERIAKTKRIISGNIRFIGELFKLRMLTIKIMNFCISKLLKSRDEEQLECLCKLISTIGKTYEEEYDAKYQRAVAESKRLGKQLQIQLTKLDVYLDEMRKLSQSEDLSSRIRFMLMDVLDLKQNRWVPRREGEKPKKIDEIRGELEKERLEKELSVQEDIIKQPQMGYPSQRRDGGRKEKRREIKPLAIVDPNTNEEVSISPDSVSRSRSESTSEAFSNKMDQMNMDCMDWNVENGPVVDLKKAIRGRLNKLTPENYDKISKNILEMEVDTEEKLSALVQIIFDKAVDDPICSHIYAPIYAELCKLMFEKEVPSASGTGKVSFRKLLLERCQQTFEKETKDEEEIVSKQKALEEADTEEKKKELQMELNERIAKTKRIMSGNIRDNVGNFCWGITFKEKQQQTVFANVSTLFSSTMEITDKVQMLQCYRMSQKSNVST